MFEEISARIERLGVVPVVVIRDAQDAVALGRALVDGGLPAAEITFRTEAARESIEILKDSFPDMLLGAGTVLTVEQAREAVSAGAHFIVSPGFAPQLVDFCLKERIAVYPGISTPTEIQMAVEKKLTILKFFPAEAIGGVSYLKAISAPFPNLRFIPTGGVNLENLAAYLSSPFVLACGGSWMVKSQLISENRFSEITRRAEEAVGLVKETRGGKL